MINWRYFSLFQINHPDKDHWKVWDQPGKSPEWQAERYAPSLQAFWSAEAARRLGEEAFRRFHRTLLMTTHRHGRALHEPGTMLNAANEAGLDLPGFQESLSDKTCLERLARDHTAAEGLGVFGTPTLVFPGAEPVYLKLQRILAREESLDFWEVFRSTAVDRPYVLEFKRPH
jgi:hypothetical protein